jgi:hypothetical protein
MSGVRPDLRQHCEQRGQYVIEATGRPLAGGGHWHPRLRLTRLSPPGLLEPSQEFQRLKPLFDSARAAILYAAEVGRHLVDEGSALIEI